MTDEEQRAVQQLRQDLAAMTRCYEAAKAQLVALDDALGEGQKCLPVVPGTARVLRVRKKFDRRDLPLSAARLEVAQRDAVAEMVRYLLSGGVITKQLTTEYDRTSVAEGASFIDYELTVTTPSPERR